MEQARRIKEIFDRCEENEPFYNVTNALDFLDLYSFRGRSVVKAFFDGKDLTIRPLNNWNVLMFRNKFYWNPNPQEFLFSEVDQLTEIPMDELAFCTTKRPIDLPGILIYLRQLVGENKWSQFVERQGVPQVIITAPEGTPDAALDAWAVKAAQIQNGGSGVLESGADVKELTSARGQDPFSLFCRHQMEMISILATGGSLNTIGGSTGLGSNLADMQNKQFTQLVDRDRKQLTRAMNQIVSKILGTLGEEKLCRWEFISDEDETDHVLDTTQKLLKLGMTIDNEKVKRLIKYDIFADTEDQKAIWTPKTENGEDENGDA